MQYHDGKDSLNKYVFKCRLKDDKDDNCLAVTGKLFHAQGPATEKHVSGVRCVVRCLSVMFVALICSVHRVCRRTIDRYVHRQRAKEKMMVACDDGRVVWNESMFAAIVADWHGYDADVAQKIAFTETI